MKFSDVLLSLLALVAVIAVTAYADSNKDRLIGGTPANPKHWPASVYASSGSARCSATVVGQKVALIAAHCVREGGKISFKIEGGTRTGICNRHPNYSLNSTADWALCKLDQGVFNTEVESVNFDPDFVQKGDVLTLTGYGCVRPGGGGGNDGIYRVGTAPVIRVPSPTGTNNDIVTRGKAALCFGDSGGPAFKYDMEGRRWEVGINSRGDISTTSYLSATHTDMAKSWFLTWMERTKTSICGLDPLARNCRKAH